MKDGRTTRSEQTRAALLSAGAQAFAAHGYAGTRLAVIARAAKANVAAISYHFGGKRALYDAVLAESGARFNRLFDELLEHGRFGDLEGFMASLWRQIRDESTHARIVLRAVLDDGRPPEGVVWMRRERLPLACGELAPIFGMAPEELRMLVLSMNLLISRYAVVDDAEFMALLAADSVEQADGILVEHLIRMVRGLVWAHGPGRRPG